MIEAYEFGMIHHEGAERALDVLVIENVFYEFEPAGGFVVPHRLIHRIIDLLFICGKLGIIGPIPIEGFGARIQLAYRLFGAGSRPGLALAGNTAELFEKVPLAARRIRYGCV